MKRFRDWSIFVKIMSLSVSAIVICSTILLFSLIPFFEDHLLEEKKHAVKKSVYIAIKTLEEYEIKSRRGEVSLQVAKQQAAEELRAFKYGIEDYFWIQDLKNNVIMHPVWINLEGKNVTDFQTPYGQYLFRDFTRVCQEQGEGFVSYHWAKTPENKPVPKVSYVRLFEPWHWVVGSGVYIDDVHSHLMDVVSRVLWVAFGVISLVVVLALYLSSFIARPLKKAIKTAREISQGKLKVDLVPRSKDETGELLKAMKEMAVNLFRSEEDLKASRTRYQQLFERMQEGFVLCEVHQEVDGSLSDFSFIEVNQAFEKYAGLPKEKLLGQRATVVFPKIHAPWLLAYAPLAFNHGVARGEERSEDLKYSFELMAYCPTPGQFAVVVEDVTVRKKMEKEKEQIQEQLFRASKFASIGTLAAGMAHEINNPLTIALGNLELLQNYVSNKKNADSREQEMMCKLEEGLRRIANIINGLRVYARVDGGEIQYFDVNRVALDTVQLVGEIYKNSGISVLSHLYPNPLFVSGSVGKFQQVLMNLMSNARDALKSKVGEKLIRLETELESNVVILKVIDTGVGIAKEQQQKIFDPFFTTKPVGEGMGLGLALCHSIVSTMGGKIEVSSELGIGTVFRVTLQQIDIQKFSPLSKVTEVVKPSGFSAGKIEGRVLLVDDEKSVRELMREYLETFGLTVTEAEGGPEALEWLKKSDFDYVVTDMKMPRMNGDVLIREGQKIPRVQAMKTHFLIITGCVVCEGSEEGELPKELDLVADGVLTKPFRIQELFQAMERLKTSRQSKS